MTGWRVLPDARTSLFSPIGLLPRDDLTGRAPVGTLRAWLDAQEPTGTWRRTDVKALVTQGGVITFPALGRRRAPVGQAARRYRVLVEAAHYIPSYRRDRDGIEFDAFPYDDANPPQAAPDLPEPLVLMPAPTYPFPSHLVVLRGAVVDSAGDAVADAEVSIAAVRRTLTDARGCFALAMPRPATSTTATLDAADLRTGRIGSVTVPVIPGLAADIQIAIL
jgi:hypothetical protein